MRTNPFIATSFSAAFLLSASAFAADHAATKGSPGAAVAGKPVKLSDAQLDQISAGGGRGGIGGDVLKYVFRIGLPIRLDNLWSS
jgi:hypothetical protein